MAQTLTRLLVHVVFSTRERCGLISPAVEAELHAYLGGICRNRESPALAIGGTDNHVHLLFQSSASKSLAETMRAVKATASKWIHETIPDATEFAWQTGYAAFSVSQSAIPKVAAYIDNQEEHHRTQTFDEEYKAFLDRHGIEYDERFVFG